MSGVFSFEAIRGVQARTAYYVVMVPLRMVSRLFRFDDEDVPADLRAQRVLSKARVPHISNYLADNKKDYILSSLCASIDGDLEFEPASDDPRFRNVGVLSFPIEARLLLNDGQHRRAGIESALKNCPELENETISVVVFADRGLKRSQQMFADLNKNAVRPSGSLGVLYNQRDPLSRLSAEILCRVPFFRTFVELEKTTISNRAAKLYTLSSLNQAHMWMIGSGTDRFSDETMDRVANFWKAIFYIMEDWQRLDAGLTNASDLRHDSVHAHGVMLQAFGLLGGAPQMAASSEPLVDLAPLRALDWSRKNLGLWEGRVINGGRINGQKRAVLLAAAVLYRTLGFKLDGRMVAAESSVGMTDGDRVAA